MREITGVILDSVFGLLLCACGWSDLRKKSMSLPLLITVSAGCAALMAFKAVPAGQRIAGAAVGILFFLISKWTHEAVGYGDSWLILLTGLYLGAPAAIRVLFAAFLLSGVCSVFWLWRRHWSRKAVIPWVPFLVLAYVLTRIFARI